MMKNAARTLLTMILAMLLGSSLGWSQSSIFDRLAHTDLLHIELAFNHDTMYAYVRSKEEQPATFRYKDAMGEWVEMDGKVRVRGRYRRRVCDFPPLRINFSKKDLREQGLLPFDKLKLVTHCMKGKDSKEAVLREYLAYQMYAALSPYALRAQLVKVNYINTGTGRKQRNYGILLEDVEELAFRSGHEVCEECFGMSAEDVAVDNYYIHTLFQYMIGNTDWSLSQVRNIDVLKPLNTGPCRIVPYDFDFAGLVDVPYAIPNADVGQQTIGQRVYMGDEPKAELPAEVKQHFRQARPAIEAKVKDCPGLNKRAQGEVLEYLGAFFEEMGE